MVFAGLKKAKERAGMFLIHTQTNKYFPSCPLDLIAYLKDATK